MFQVRYLFMSAMLAAASYSSGGSSTCLAVSARRVIVPGGSTYHLEPVTIIQYTFYNFFTLFLILGSCGGLRGPIISPLYVVLQILPALPFITTLYFIFFGISFRYRNNYFISYLLYFASFGFPYKSVVVFNQSSCCSKVFPVCFSP